MPELVGSVTLGNLVTASSVATNMHIEAAFDGVIANTYWQPDNGNTPNPDGSCWLKFDLLAEYIISGFACYSGTGTYDTYIPKDLEIFGSPTGAFTGEEVSLGQITMPDTPNNLWSPFVTLPSPGKFRYLKICFYSQYLHTVTVFAIAELKFEYQLAKFISGTLKTVDSDASGIAADYAIIKRSDGTLLVAGTAAADGTYSEPVPDGTTEYDVIMLDPNGTYNPKIIGEKVTGV